MWRAHVIQNDYTRKPNNSHSIYHLLYIGHGLEFYTDILKPDDRKKKKRRDLQMTAAKKGGRKESEARAKYLKLPFQ